MGYVTEQKLITKRNIQVFVSGSALSQFCFA
nr:MAG TPA: hypothetical protein [Bacteriophage sp.]